MPVSAPLPEPRLPLSLLMKRKTPHATQRFHGGPFLVATLSFQPEQPGG